MPSIALLSVLKDQRSVSHAHITVILNPIFASPAAAIFIFRTFIFPRHAPLLAWLVSSPFWIGVVRGRCRLSWLAPAEMKENNEAHVHREQSITLIGSHKSSFTIQTVPYLTCTRSLTLHVHGASPPFMQLR